MPVKFDDYEVPSNEATNGEVAPEIDPDSNAYTLAIIAFLTQHPDEGFTPKEIHEQTSIARGSIRNTLRELRDRDLVRYKAPYWAANLRGIQAYEEILDSVAG